MQKLLRTLATLAAAAFAAVGGAAPIPQEWAVEVSRVRQYQFQATHGDTMELKATFWHDGEPFDLGGEPFRLYWQTNAMESIYWSAPATASSNTVSAVFANTMDPGAPIVYGFLGATSGNYRASFSIRFAPGPGAVPNELPLPAATIDFAKVEVLNPPYATKEGLAEAASSSTNYTDSVAQGLRDDIATTASSATNYTDRAIAALSDSIPSTTNALAQALVDGSIEVRAASARFADEADEAGVAGMARVANGLYGENSERTADEIFTSIDAAASTNDVMLTPIYSDTPTFSEWTFSGTSPSSGHHWEVIWEFVSQEYRLFDVPDGQTWESVIGVSEYVVNIDGTLTTVVFPTVGVTATRTRTDIIGYTLGSQSDKPLQPKGDYAPATNIAKSALASDVQASLGKADTALQTAPVTSVNGKTGAVVLDTTDIQDNSTGTSLASLLSFMNGNIQGKAPLASPAFTGTPTAPTPASGDNSAKVATTEFVQAAVAGGGGGTPLSGQTFNFATTQGVMDALKTVIEALGGTVVNAPSTTISQGE